MQVDSEELIIVDTLAIGLTRPVIKWGVPIGAAAIIIAVSVELVLFGFLLVRNPLFGFVGVPMYLLARQKARIEERFIELMAAAARTRWFNPGRKVWKAATSSPMRYRKTRRTF
jgi:type IV secretion system protein VirB3